MKKLLLMILLIQGSGHVQGAEPLRDRFVWIFGWNLETQGDVAEISRLLETAGGHGLNGAVVSFGLDTLCQKSPDYFDRLARVKSACERNKLELIPAVFSVGYGGGVLAHDRNLAEGLPVEDAPFLVGLGKARLVSDAPANLENGAFERFREHRFASFNFHDQPGEISFADTAVQHGGKASIRLQNFFDHEAKLLAERLHPKRVLLNMDEIRMGGTCLACAGRDMGELLGECITRQVQILRRYLPEVEVLIWSDMLDPNHNAHGNYYLVSGDFTGSWRHVPKDLVMAVWGDKPQEKNVRFFSDLGFRTLGACYYDADDLNDVKKWLDLARRTSGMQGLMYTPWLRKYALLGDFGDLFRSP
jgi:hypothetical protein